VRLQPQRFRDRASRREPTLGRSVKPFRHYHKSVGRPDRNARIVGAEARHFAEATAREQDFELRLSQQRRTKR
jgi:hypothetical protein